MIRKSMILCFCFLNIILNAYGEQIKLYTFYTPSHESLFENWFLPSIQDEYELVIKVHEQKCISGNYMEEGWISTMKFKYALLIKAIIENYGSFFIFSDVDIQFFGSTENLIREALQDKDMVFQRDDPNGNLCTGFFACKANYRTLRLIYAVRSRLLSEDNKTSEQILLNMLIRSGDFDNVIWSYLPDNFFGGGSFSGELWEPGQNIQIPHNPLMHHANWTIGVENKIEQLRYVRSCVEGYFEE